ncbi:MAG: DMT family transporter [Chloroflexota bacterium]
MTNLGIWWAVASGIGFGLFSVNNRRVVRHIDVYIGAFILFTVTALTLGTIALITEEWAIWQQLSPSAIFYFGLAGAFHFFFGWTFFIISQKRVGAARTSVIMSTMPLFATIIGWLFLGEILTTLAFIGIGLIVLGVYIVARDNVQAAQSSIETGWQSYVYALGTAICFAISPLFIRYGLDIVPSPMIGSTVGMGVCVIGYIGLLTVQGGWRDTPRWVKTQTMLTWQLTGGVVAGLATGARWIALETVQIAPVVALSRLSVPIILFLSPIVVGQQHEQVTMRIWMGAIAILGGSLLLIFYA